MENYCFWCLFPVVELILLKYWHILFRDGTPWQIYSCSIDVLMRISAILNSSNVQGRLGMQKKNGEEENRDANLIDMREWYLSHLKQVIWSNKLLVSKLMPLQI